MACLSSSNRACARVVQEKLCQLVAVSKSQLGYQQQQQQQQQVQLLHATGPVASTVGNGVGGGGGGGGGGGIGASLPKVGAAGKRTFLLSSGCAYPLYSVGPAGTGTTPLVAAVAHSVGGSIGIARNFYTGRGNFIQPTSVARSAGVPADALLFERNQKCSSTANLHPCMRGYSSVHTQQPAGPIREYNIDPYILLEDELKYIFEDIRQEISRATNHQELNKIAVYYFDGQGKAFRPMVAILMAKALNYHMHNENSNIVNAQRQIAMISEMIHTASLVHDDVIDQSFARRGKPSVNVLWNHKKVTQAGDYILAVASMLLARLKHDEVTHILSQVLTDLVQGEFMQLGSKETENERFAHYFTKTYRKTASLIANSLKAVAVLSGADEQMAELSFQYGRNLGLAFQFVDDLLDFVSSSEAMGKPAAADLKLGLATAPVLFACEKFPELNPMILRRFREPGDVERAYELVHQSQGLEQTRFLARKHCIEALRLASQISESPYQKGLIVVGDFVLNRMK
ncbi:decaprenyl-diphosphate synthase subunit 1-like [Anopheles stephensi]|uniref:decaprenyl-diphosphate synthase subunit 1-like n=1 Tax=Anopheles stephensi TaxID=30069 RepID=UPI001658B9AD|nr:decaprenyl-diphosphate synthase subunit 1-like [Anopheles stephensi]XP_035918000.1 decaprenyl-diphosphate synthase subunit 1-like [Anopheles stephensi]